MIKKNLIIIAYYSKWIINVILGVYLLLLIVLRNSIYKSHFPDFFLYLFLFLLGIYIGLYLMTSIIKFLNKKEIVENSFFQKLKRKKRNNVSDRNKQVG